MTCSERGLQRATATMRAKIDDPFEVRMLHTVRGMGYVLELP